MPAIEKSPAQPVTAEYIANLQEHTQVLIQAYVFDNIDLVIETNKHAQLQDTAARHQYYLEHTKMLADILTAQITPQSLKAKLFKKQVNLSAVRYQEQLLAQQVLHCTFSNNYKYLLWDSKNGSETYTAPPIMQQAYRVSQRPADLTPLQTLTSLLDVSRHHYHWDTELPSWSRADLDTARTDWHIIADTVHLAIEQAQTDFKNRDFPADYGHLHTIKLEHLYCVLHVAQAFWQSYRFN